MLLKFEKEYFVHTSMVGKGDFIRPAAILDLFQDSAGLHANKIGVGFDDISKNGFLWVVSYLEYEVVGKLPRSLKDVKVTTWPHKHERFEYIREYEMKDKDDNLILKGISNWVLVDINSHKLVKDDLPFNGEYYEYTNYPNYRRRKLNLESGSDSINYDYQVAYTDLDHNGHMNNAKYLDVIYNFHKNMDDLTKIKKTMITFNHEALINDIINVTYYKNTDADDCYIGKINDNTSFQVVIEVE